MMTAARVGPSAAPGKTNVSACTKPFHSGRSEARQPRHPAHLETGELAEGLARINVASAGLVEVAACLGKAQRKQQHGSSSERNSP
jgi:hypothetical protein